MVLATGVTPRHLNIEGYDNPKVLDYLEVLRDKKPVGKRVAVIGAGGIGFDVSEYLTHEGESATLNPKKFFAEWGIDTSYEHRGGITTVIIPKENEKDLVEIPDNIKQNLMIKPVRWIDEVLEIALQYQPVPR